MKKTDRKFRDLTGYRLRNTSLLHQFDILQDDDGEYLLNLWKNYYIPDETKDNEDYIYHYDVPENSWWDTIAEEAYGNDKLWWIIAHTNDTVNPFEELTPGDSIRILDDNFLYQIIKEIRNISEL